MWPNALQELQMVFSDQLFSVECPPENHTKDFDK
jgi:hypothetical protein